MEIEPLLDNITLIYRIVKFEQASTPPHKTRQMMRSFTVKIELDILGTSKI